MSKDVEVRGYVYSKNQHSFGLCTDYNNETRSIVYTENQNVLDMLRVGSIVKCAVKNVRYLGVPFGQSKPDVVCCELKHLYISDYEAKRKRYSVYFMLHDAYVFSDIVDKLAAFVRPVRSHQNGTDYGFDLVAMDNFDRSLYEEFLELTLSDIRDIQTCVCSEDFNLFKYRADRYALHSALQNEINHRDNPDSGWGDWH